MGRVSLSTNIDLQNYEHRIDDIARSMHPVGIEIFSLPQNYPTDAYSLELPDRQDSSSRFVLLNKELARDVGRRLRKHGIRRAQFHYPWQKNILDLGGDALALTIQFCDTLLEESCAEQLTINYHNILRYPVLSVIKGLVIEELSGDYRRDIHTMLEGQAKLSAIIRDQMGSECLLVLENNPARSVLEDKKVAPDTVDNVDLVAEDYIGRVGIDGTVLDYAHAWTVVGYFRGDKRYPNLEWCRGQYGGVPRSAESMEAFVKAVTHRVKWLHLSDELHPFTHTGSHIGNGKIDFKECAELLGEHLIEDVVATIEVANGHKPEGLRRIIEHDFPRLLTFFGRYDN